MNKKQLIFVWVMVLLLSGCITVKVSKTPRIIMPEPIVFEGREYVSYNDLDNNIVIKKDFDGDGRVETLVGFWAETDPKLRIPQSLIVIGSEEKGKFFPELVIPGNDYFSRVELKDIDSDGLSEILFWSGGGAHYTSLDIYKYNKCKIRNLFSNGSACGVETQKNPFTIKIYREDFDNPKWCYAMETNKYEIWQWDGKKLSYNKALSTTKLMTEEEAQDESYHKLYMRE